MQVNKFRVLTSANTAVETWQRGEFANFAQQSLYYRLFYFTNALRPQQKIGKTWIRGKQYNEIDDFNMRRIGVGKFVNKHLSREGSKKIREQNEFLPLLLLKTRKQCRRWNLFKTSSNIIDFTREIWFYAAIFHSAIDYTDNQLQHSIQK